MPPATFPCCTPEYLVLRLPYASPPVPIERDPFGCPRIFEFQRGRGRTMVLYTVLPMVMLFGLVTGSVSRTLGRAILRAEKARPQSPASFRRALLNPAVKSPRRAFWCARPAPENKQNSPMGGAASTVSTLNNQNNATSAASTGESVATERIPIEDNKEGNVLGDICEKGNFEPGPAVGSM